MDAIPLTGKQRRFLKGRAQRLEPAVWVGDAGITAGVLHSLDLALRSHELVKVRMRQPDDKKAMAARLATESGAALLGLVGHTALLSRANPDDPVIELPP